MSNLPVPAEAAKIQTLAGEVLSPEVVALVAAPVITEAEAILQMQATNAVEAKAIVDRAHALKEQLKALEGLMKGTDLRRLATLVDAPFKPAQDVAKRALAHARSEPQRYQKEAELEQARALAAAAATGAGPQEIARAVAVAQPRPKGHIERTVKKWRVVNFAAMPDEFKTEDTRKIDALFKATGGVPPGVEIYEETTGVLR